MSSRQGGTAWCRRIVPSRQVDHPRCCQLASVLQMGWILAGASHGPVAAAAASSSEVRAAGADWQKAKTWRSALGWRRTMFQPHSNMCQRCRFWNRSLNSLNLLSLRLSKSLHLSPERLKRTSPKKDAFVPGPISFEKVPMEKTRLGKLGNASLHCIMSC